MGAVALVFAAATCHAQTFYKWKDASGATHYSDSPPATGNATKVAVRAGVSAEEGKTDQPAPAASAPATASPSPELLEAEARYQKQSCEAARRDVAAVQSGRIAESRIDASVRRILATKARAGLSASRFVDLESVDHIVGRRAHTELARHVAERSITLARDSGQLVPLAGDARRVLVLTYAAQSDLVSGSAFVAALGAQPGARRVVRGEGERRVARPGSEDHLAHARPDQRRDHGAGQLSRGAH